MPKPTKNPTPSLSARGATWVQQMIDHYSICEPARLALIRAAGEEQDRMWQAQRLIRKHGALIPDRFGQLKTNPAVGIERAARASMLRALKQLKLDVEEKRRPGRPGRPIGMSYEALNWRDEK